jgi:hypothetical protein
LREIRQPFIEEDFKSAFCSAEEQEQEKKQKIKREREKAMKKRLQSNPIFALLQNQVLVYESRQLTNKKFQDITEQPDENLEADIKVDAEITANFNFIKPYCDILVLGQCSGGSAKINGKLLQ